MWRERGGRTGSRYKYLDCHVIGKFQTVSEVAYNEQEDVSERAGTVIGTDETKWWAVIWCDEVSMVTVS